MVHIDKRKEDPAVARTIRFYDRWGNHLTDAVAYDHETGYGIKIDENGNEKQFYFKGGSTIVDHVANPTHTEDMDDFRLMTKIKHFPNMTDEQKHEVYREIKKMKDKQRRGGGEDGKQQQQQQEQEQEQEQ